MGASRFIEGVLCDCGGYLGSDSAWGKSFIDNQQSPCLGYRIDDGLRIQRSHGAGIDDFHRDAFGGQTLSCFEAFVNINAKATTVTSLPERAIAALPNSMKYSPSGT